MVGGTGAISVLSGRALGNSSNQPSDSPDELADLLERWSEQNGGFSERTLELVRTYQDGSRYYRMNFTFSNSHHENILIYSSDAGNWVLYPGGRFQADSRVYTQTNSHELDLPELTMKTSETANQDISSTSSVPDHIVKRSENYHHFKELCSDGCESRGRYRDYGAQYKHLIYGTTMELGDLNPYQKKTIAWAIVEAVKWGYDHSVSKRKEMIIDLITMIGQGKISGEIFSVAFVDEDLNWGLGTESLTRVGGAYGIWKPRGNALMTLPTVVPGHAYSTCLP